MNIYKGSPKNLTLCFSIIITIIFLIIMDLIWFSFSMKTIYMPTIQSIQGNSMPDKYKFIYGGLVAWVLIALGINYFVVKNATNVKNAMVNGALFGLVMYGIFNGTNYALFEGWNLKTSIIDTLWGMYICGSVSGSIFYLKSMY